MPDINNVIKAVDMCLGHGTCNDCPYCLSGKGYATMNCRDYMLRDVLTLIQEQKEETRKLKTHCCSLIANEIMQENKEEHKGKWKDNNNGTISCSECGTWFPKEREPYMYFCGYCGAKMESR